MGVQAVATTRAPIAVRRPLGRHPPAGRALGSRDSSAAGWHPSGLHFARILRVAKACACAALLTAAPPRGVGAFELPSPLVDVSYLSGGIAEGEASVRNVAGTIVAGRALFTDSVAYEALAAYREYLGGLGVVTVASNATGTISQLPVAAGVTAQLRAVRFASAVTDATRFVDGAPLLDRVV